MRDAFEVGQALVNLPRRHSSASGRGEGVQHSAMHGIGSIASALLSFDQVANPIANQGHERIRKRGHDQLADVPGVRVDGFKKSGFLGREHPSRGAHVSGAAGWNGGWPGGGSRHCSA